MNHKLRFAGAAAAVVTVAAVYLAVKDARSRGKVKRWAEDLKDANAPTLRRLLSRIRTRGNRTAAVMAGGAE